MGARLPLRLLRGLSSSFDSAFFLMSRGYGGMKRSSRGLLLILADFCASFYGGARGRKRSRFAPRLSQVAASGFAVRHSVVEATRRFHRTSRPVSALRSPSPIFQSPAWRRFKATSAADIRSEKYRPLGGRFERNGLGYCNRHRALSRLRSC